ncbi:MAG: hypothetical protein GW941_02690 [Candidatus Pacebacteria bacterium]|nr:hypothetical protein [Candidatus Paceibacterota bacterium]
MKDQDFVSLLQEQAQLQSKLNKERLFPKEVDWLTSIIGNYPWQFILVISILGAVVWDVFLS